MTIYQLRKKLKKWKEYKRKCESGRVYYDKDWLIYMGLDDIAKNEDHYTKLLRRAEKTANEVIKKDVS